MLIKNRLPTLMSLFQVCKLVCKTIMLMVNNMKNKSTHMEGKAHLYFLTLRMRLLWVLKWVISQEGGW